MSTAATSSHHSLPIRFFGLVRLLPATLLLLLTVSCAVKPFQPYDLAPPDVDRLLQRLQQQATGFHTIEGKANVVIESPEYRQSGVAAVALIYPESLRITFEGPFGVDVADFLVSRTTLQFYNRRENLVFRGPFTRENLRQLVGINLRLDEILHLVAGQQAVAPLAILPPVTGRRFKDRIALAGRTPEVGILIDLDPQGRYVTRVRQVAADGAVMQEQEYGQFRRINDLWFPDFIRLQRIPEKRRITIQFRTRRINRPLHSGRFHIQVPASAKQIVLNRE